MRDRRRIERSLVDQKLPLVLVATQVVEVSLDISYQKGYFEAAPIDALSQRMGRVNRKGLNPPAAVVIATQPLNKHPIYDSTRTDKTVTLLRNISGSISEQSLVEICDEVYDRGYEGEDLQMFSERLYHRNFTNFEDTLVAGDHEDWISEAIDGLDGRVDVLPVGLKREFNQLRAEHRWLEADALSVNIYRSPRLKDTINTDHDPWVIDAPYGPDGLDLP